MAKMRYCEMPRDASCDSLSALKIIEERCEKRSPLSESECESEVTPNGCQDMCLLETPTKRRSSREEASKRLPETPKRLSRTPTSVSIKKTQSSAGYDNLGAVGVGNKSQSLPNGASLKSMEFVVLEALRVSPEDFASQLCLLDLAVFKKIAPEELASCAWNKKNKLTVAPNVVIFTQRFNHVSFWTVQEVLSGTTPKHRAEILSHFIRIGKSLYELNNFHSLFAIISALQSASVYRLSKTWSHVSKKEKLLFDRLAEVFSDSNNWQNLREHMECIKLPCIPYLGVFLTDLVYIDMAHPYRGGLESEQRRHKMNNILRVIADLQQSCYTQLQHTLPHIQRYLRSVRYIEELQKFVEDDQYKLSLKLEPPSPAPSSSSSKESVSEITMASLNLSPAKSLRLQPTVAKFVPGHRKCRSLGTKFRSTSLPRNFHNQGLSPRRGSPSGYCQGVFSKPPVSSGHSRHLLDDSVLEETVRDHTISPPVAITTLNRSPLVSEGEIEEALSMQGFLRRKNLMKDGRKPALSSWQRYWVQLWASALVFYLPKSFKGSERCDFKREPCKIMTVSNCLVSLSDNPLQSDVFHLRDPLRKNLYKFRAVRQSSAREWYEAIQNIIGESQDKLLPTNLISFE